jgi:hypothetical protein
MIIQAKGLRRPMMTFAHLAGGKRMSCWVVPMVAAEMWGVPVGSVLEKARSGEVPSKSENGFLFIDVAPGSPTCDPPKALRPAHPPTYVVVNANESVAVATGDGVLDEHLMPPIPRDDWRLGRQYAARARRRPAMN